MEFYKIPSTKEETRIENKSFIFLPVVPGEEVEALVDPLEDADEEAPVVEEEDALVVPLDVVPELPLVDAPAFPVELPVELAVVPDAVLAVEVSDNALADVPVVPVVPVEPVVPVVPTLIIIEPSLYTCSSSTTRGPCRARGTCCSCSARSSCGSRRARRPSSARGTSSS